MIVDSHCHAGRGDLLTAPWNTRAALATYLARARRAGITRTVVCPAFSSDNQFANRELADIVRLAARLGVEAIGLYQFHRPDPEVPYAESIGAIRDLLDEGVIRMAGISNADVAQIDEANAWIYDDINSAPLPSCPPLARAR